MKKTLYFVLTLTLLFSSCKEENIRSIQGCTDPNAINYNANAIQNNNSCIYNISGVWETTSAVLNGVEQLGKLIDMELTYIFADGQIGSEEYKSGLITNYAIGTTTSSSDPNVVSWSGTYYPTGQSAVDLNLIWNINSTNNNMTWIYVDYPSKTNTYLKTLVRSNTYSLSDWK